MTMTQASPRSMIRTVSLDDIVVDPAVQRLEGVDQNRVNEIAAKFNPDALGVIVLSHRLDGTYVCLDGMHRCAGARRVGWTAPVNAIVFEYLSIAEEASLFLLYNKKKDPSAVSRFKARVLARDPVAMDVDETVRFFGWTIGTAARNAGVIAAVDALERVYRNGFGTRANGAHSDLLVCVLAVVTEAWGDDPEGTSGVILGGLAQLYGRYGSAVDTRKLVRELMGTQPRALIGKARNWRDVQGGTVPAAMAKVLVGLHNTKRRTHLLPDWVWTR